MRSRKIEATNTHKKLGGQAYTTTGPLAIYPETTRNEAEVTGGLQTAN